MLYTYYYILYMRTSQLLLLRYNDDDVDRGVRILCKQYEYVRWRRDHV